MSILPPVAFGWLDAFYLRQERLFRELYQDSISPTTEVRLLAMSTEKYARADLYPRCTYRSVVVSNTWRVLHLTIIGIGLLLLGVAILDALGSTELSNRIRSVI